MHELGLMRSLMRIVEAEARKAGAERVTAITVSLGALSPISDEHLRRHFDEAARGTVSEGARLIVEREPLRAYCPGCRQEFTLNYPADPCPLCGSGKTEIRANGELRVRGIEVEET